MTAAAPLLPCASGEPCAHFECEHHMTAVVTSAMRKRPVENWPESCQLRCPDGPLTLEEIGGLLGCSRERIRQIEAAALAKLLNTARRRFRGCEGAADFVADDDGRV